MTTRKSSKTSASDNQATSQATARILVLHGPNLNLLGTREPDVYGRTTLADIHAAMETRARAAGVQLESFQSNGEGELINRVQSARDEGVGFIIINPAAYTHTSVALRDALRRVDIPRRSAPSNIYAREAFRQHSYFSDLAVGVISAWAPAATSWRSTTRCAPGAGTDLTRHIGRRGNTCAIKAYRLRIPHGSSQTENASSTWCRRPASPNWKSPRARRKSASPSTCTPPPAPAATVHVAAPVALPAAAVAPVDAGVSDLPEGHVVKAPMVGTFYRASAPGAKPFVEVGQTVAAGDPLFIIEAMKLMNEIEADTAGVIKAILVENGQPVEYGQPLAVIG